MEPTHALPARHAPVVRHALLAAADRRFGAPAPAGNVCRAFDRATETFADRVAVTDGERALTFAELREQADAIAHGLREAGVSPGDRVALLMPNCVAFLPAMFGVLKAGAVFTQVAARAGIADVEYMLGHVRARALIYDERFDATVAQVAGGVDDLDVLVRAGSGPAPDGSLTLDDLVAGGLGRPPLPLPADGDLAFAGFTSGTTGTPKAVLLDHARWSYFAIVAGLEVADTRPGEVFVHVAPLTHFTIIFVLPTLMRGGTNVVLEAFQTDRFLDQVVAQRATATALVPTIIYALLDTPGAVERMASLRTIAYAGSPMSSPRLAQALDALGQVFAQTYAGSEPGFVSCLRKEEHELALREAPARLASAGRPLWHVELEIRDDAGAALLAGEAGEIWVRSPGQMLAYWDARLDADTIRDGWVRTGDVGLLDDEGYLYIVDRKKDMIVTGGMNVFPAQVEAVITRHPGVAQCAVIGIPHDKWGEAVTAFCVPRPGAQLEPDELIGLVKAAKGSIWAPKEVHVVDALPTNANGKVDKRRLREPYWAGRERLVN